MFEKIGSIQRDISIRPLDKCYNAWARSPKQALSPPTLRNSPAHPNPVSQLVTLFGLFAALFGTVAPSYAQPIDPATARDAFTGGGLTIGATDLQRIAAGLPPRDVRLINDERPTTAAAITPSAPLPYHANASAVALPPTDATLGNGARRAHDTSVSLGDESPTHHRVHQENPESTSTTHALGSSPTMPPLPPTSTPRGGSGRVLLVECNGAFGYATIQSAIDDAVDGDIVVVLPNDCTPEGRWFENINFLGKAIRVQSANPQDEAIVDATVIDGNANGTVVTFENGEGLDSVLDGVVVTNGGDAPASGILIAVANPLIRNCHITEHTVGTGRAILNSSVIDRTRFEDCLFESNGLPDGSTFGIIFASQTVAPDFIRCTFRNNTGRLLFLGGIGLPTNCEGDECIAIIRDCRFESNNCGTVVSTLHTAIENCDFVDNFGNQISGSGLEIRNCNLEGGREDATALYTQFTIIENCSIRNFNAVGSVVRLTRDVFIDGLEFVDNVSAETTTLLLLTITMESNLPMIKRLRMVNNQAKIAPLIFGSGLMPTFRECAFTGNLTDGVAGAVLVSSVGLGPAKLEQCTFTSNIVSASIEEPIASAVYADDFVELDSCLFIGNQTQGDGGALTGQIFATNSTIIGNASNGPTGGVENVTLENCIVYNNRGTGGVEDQTAQLAPGTMANYCNIQNFSGLLTEQGAPLASVGNFDLDPRFVDPGYWDDVNTPDDPSDDVFIPGDYHLLPDSPCIDAGDPEFLPDESATDIDGEARVQSCRVDIGADEFTQDDVAVPGDFDGDGFVSLADVPEFLSVALGPVGSQVCQGDLTGDGRFDGRDIAALTALLIGN